MSIRKAIRPLLVVAALIAATAANADEARKLEWKDLAPAGDLEKLASAQVMNLLRAAPHGSADDTTASMQAIQPGMYTTVDALDGNTVRISGFVVPLEIERGASREFLLVPYYGACIHAPPPPPNQTILVRAQTPVALGSLSIAYEAEGSLHTSQNSSAMGDSAYLLNLTSLRKHK